MIEIKLLRQNSEEFEGEEIDENSGVDWLTKHLTGDAITEPRKAFIAKTRGEGGGRIKIVKV